MRFWKLWKLKWKLRRGSFIERRFAAEDLGRLADSRAIKSLVAALIDDDKEVREAAYGALLQVDRNWRESKDGKKSIPMLVAALKNSNSNVRKAAVEALSSYRDIRVIKPLVATLKDKDIFVQSAATRALAQIKDSWAVMPLIAVLKDPSYGSTVREAAAEALGQIRDAQAVKPLVAALDDEYKEVRKKAAQALKSLDWQPVDNTQRACLAVLRQDWTEAVSLGSVSIEPLVETLDDKDKEVQKKAAQALKSLGWQPVDNLQHARLAVLCQDWKVLISLGPIAIEPLVEALRNFLVETEAVWTIGQIGDERAIEPLIALLKRYSDDFTMYAAIEALLNILQRNAAGISLENLRELARLQVFRHEEKEELIEHGDSARWISTPNKIPVDCSKIQQLAQQELISRGLEA